MANRGRPRGSKNLSKKLLKERKQDNLSEESKKLIEQGLKEAKEGKLERLDPNTLEKIIQTPPIVHKLASDTQYQISQERKDKLRLIMGEINKAMGDSTMMKFGADEPPKESIDFGIKSIDELLGGGAVIGNFIVIYGSEGVGKCVEGNTLIVTDKGLQKIKNLNYKKNGFTVVNVGLITPLGKNNTSHIFKQQINKYIVLTLEDGSKITGTLNHPILTNRGFIKLSDITKKDEIFTTGGLINLVNPSIPKIDFKPKYSKMTSNTNKLHQFPKNMSKNLAFILGYHLGDGNHNDNNFVITFGHKQKMNSFIGKLKNLFGNKLKYNFLKQNNNYRFITQKILRNYCQYLGHEVRPIKELEIPSIIFISPKDIIGAFIYGLLAADGWISKRGTVITLDSPKVIYQLQQLLLYIGIRSNISTKYNNKYKKNYVTLTVGNKDEMTKLASIMLPRKNGNKGFIAKFSKYINKEQGKQKKEISYFVFTQKIKNKEIINKPLWVYDVTVPQNHIFIGNGLINHNSTLAYCQIAEAQRHGKICAYIDLEHSFTKERAVQFGVHLEDLVLIENCETAEDAMNISIKLSKEKVCDLIVLDSVNAMSPHDEQYEGKGEKEREMEKEEMALLAKKLGKFLRRVAPFIYKGKVAYLLIGQVRTEGLGGFTTREGLSGGHGLKHWSMQTIYLRKGQSVDAPTEKYKDAEGKTKDRRIGFDCVLKIDKSKKTNSKPELTDLHIPYLFKEGFKSV